MRVTHWLSVALKLTLLVGVLGMAAACATSRTRTAQEVSDAVRRPDAGVTAGPTGSAPYGVGGGPGLSDQERRRLLEAARAAFASTTDETTSYTVVPQNIDAEPTAVTARPAGPLENRADGAVCRPIDLSVTKQGGTTRGTLTFCRASGARDIKVSPVI